MGVARLNALQSKNKELEGKLADLEKDKTSRGNFEVKVYFNDIPGLHKLPVRSTNSYCALSTNYVARARDELTARHGCRVIKDDVWWVVHVWAGNGSSVNCRVQCLTW